MFRQQLNNYGSENSKGRREERRYQRKGPVKARPVTKGARREELRSMASFPPQLQHPTRSSVSEAGPSLDPGIPLHPKTQREGAKFQFANI